MSGLKIGNSLGKPVDRVDGRLKVTGGAKYAAEYPLKNLAYGVLLQSTVSKGRIKKIDTQEAERVPGVVTIMTYLNAPKIPAKPASDFNNALHLLQDNVIYHDRQNIGVVVADTFEAASEAASLVKITYDRKAPTVHIESELSKAFAPGGEHSQQTKRGDVDNAWKKAAVKVEHTYKTPAEIHSPMEPHATTAVWDGDELTVYESTQAIFATRDNLAKAFGLPPSKVRVITHFIGGGFGTKLTTWSATILTAAVAKKIGRPVKLALARSQTFGPTGHRPVTIQAVKLGAGADGKLVALSHECISETCSYSDFIEHASGISTRLYSCPNVSTNQKIVRVDVGMPTWMRAPGEAPGSFALESAMDELAYALKMDPIQLRLVNYANKDEHDNLPWSSNSLKECYKQGAAKFGWQKRNPQPRSMRKGDLLVGWGMATATHPTFRMKASAKVKLLPDGTALVQSGTQDIGTGTYTVMTQVAADALALPLTKVKFELGDTLLPESPLSGGSMTAAAVGSAVSLACLDVVKKIVKIAVADKSSPLHGHKENDIQASNQGLCLRADPKIAESYVEIMKRHGSLPVEATASSASDANAEKYSKHSFGAHFAEVQVDPDLGTVRVTRFLSAVGAGRILNSKTAGSQIKGGIIYGIGMALTEEILRDGASGRVMNADLGEYHLPVHADTPDINVIFVDEHDSVINPIGAKGIGEIAMIGIAPAIANAVYHATGKRIRELPITLDKLL